MSTHQKDISHCTQLSQAAVFEVRFEPKFVVFRQLAQPTNLISPKLFTGV